MQKYADKKFQKTITSGTEEDAPNENVTGGEQEAANELATSRQLMMQTLQVSVSSCRLNLSASKETAQLYFPASC